jgi:hypothetical protein
MSPKVYLDLYSVVTLSLMKHPTLLIIQFDLGSIRLALYSRCLVILTPPLLTLSPLPSVLGKSACSSTLTLQELSCRVQAVTDHWVYLVERATQ